MTAIPGFTCDTTEIWDPAIARDINPLILEAARKTKIEVLDMEVLLQSYFILMVKEITKNEIR